MEEKEEIEKYKKNRGGEVFISSMVIIGGVI
jgi:hypothetical protein